MYDGGYNGYVMDSTEEYDGSTWSTGGDLITARYFHGSCGTATAGLSFGGDLIIGTEEYNGTSWSSGGDVIVTKRRQGSSGTQISALNIAGDRSSIGDYDYHVNEQGSDGTSGSTNLLRFSTNSLTLTELE